MVIAVAAIQPGKHVAASAYKSVEKNVTYTGRDTQTRSLRERKSTPQNATDALGSRRNGYGWTGLPNVSKFFPRFYLVTVEKP